MLQYLKGWKRKRYSSVRFLLQLVPKIQRMAHTVGVGKRKKWQPGLNSGWSVCIHTKLEKRESAATRSFRYRVQLSTSKMTKAESSKAAANGVKPNPNAAGGANYELPWYVTYSILAFFNEFIIFIGLKSTARFSLTTLLETRRQSSASKLLPKMAICRMSSFQACLESERRPRSSVLHDRC